MSKGLGLNQQPVGFRLLGKGGPKLAKMPANYLQPTALPLLETFQSVFE